MKKALLLLASAVLLLVGCAKEQTKEVDGALTEVTFTASVESGVVTKAAADLDGAAASVNRCIMEIYYGDGLYARQIAKVTDKQATFSAQVPSNRTYTVAFWADCVADATTDTGLAADKYYTTTSLKEIGLNGSYIGNNDARDAFFACKSCEVKQGGTAFTAELKRPFAQMNVITTDWDKAASVTGLAPEKVDVTVKNALVAFNAVTGEASGSQALNYEAAVYAPAANGAEKTLSMDYLFASDTKALIDIDWKARKTGDTDVAHAFAAVPYQRNYRTNIKGKLLTTTGSWTVNVEPQWSTPDYDVPFYAASSITDAQNYISSQNTEQAKVVDLSKATIKTTDLVGDDGDKKIEFKLKTTSPTDMVSFTLPAIPAEVTEAGCTGWKITYDEGYPTQNVNVNAPTGTNVVIEAPISHVTLNGEVYEQVTSTTGDGTLVVPAGVTVKNLTVKKGAVEIHGAVGALVVSPEVYSDGSIAKVVFRACEGLSATVFEKIYKESDNINYIDPMYAYKQVGENYDIYKLPVVAMIGEKEYPSIAAALAAVQANETIEILSDIALDERITISNSDITIDGNSHTIAVSDAEYWNQYKIGGAAAGLGAVNMISVTGSKFTLKDITLDGKDCRGVSLCTTSGGKDVLYQNVTYTGRGSGHYYGEAAGLVTFDGCKFDTHGYAVHFGGESSVDDDVVIKDCELNGWSSFGACKSVTISDSHFGGANDEGKNGWLAVLRPYCPTTITNCTFSDIYLHEAVTGYDFIGLGTGAATTVVLKGCKIVNDSKEETDAAIYSIVRDNGFDNEAAQQGSVFAFDATGNATDGYTAGTFYAKNPANIRVAGLNEVVPIEGKENVYTIVPKQLDETTVAVLGATEYSTFEAAMQAALDAKGGTITLVKDVTLAKSWDHGSNIGDNRDKYSFVLNLNGKTIFRGPNNYHISLCDNDWTVIDETGEGSINKASDGTSNLTYWCNNGHDPFFSKMAKLETCPVFILNGGTYSADGNFSDIWNRKYGVDFQAGGTGDNHMAICKFLLNNAAIRNMRILNGQGEIKGGTISGQILFDIDDTKYTQFGIQNSDLYTIISGGVFTLDATTPFIFQNHFTASNLQIKGGTFNFNPSVNYSACIPAGYTCQDNGDGTWTVVAGS